MRKVKLLVKNVPREGEFFIQLVNIKFYENRRNWYINKKNHSKLAALVRVSPFIIQSLARIVLSTTRFYNKPVERKLDPPRSKI